MWLLLQQTLALVSNQYSNTSRPRWLDLNAPDLRLYLLSLLARPRFVRQCRAMASQRKPVIVRKFSKEWFAGYAEAGFGQDAAELEILDLTGKVLRIGWDQVKWVCYVRDFPANPLTRPIRNGFFTSGLPSGRGLSACGCA